ncbi:hypothetical protein LCGC14_2972990, partial [marine sediment metagenome]
DVMNIMADQFDAVSPTGISRLDAFWPRFVKDAKTGKVTVKTPIGAKQSPAKMRIIEEMQDGLESGVNYDTPLNSLDLYIKSMQKMTRDRVLRNKLIEEDVGRVLSPLGFVDDATFAAQKASREVLQEATRAVKDLEGRRVSLAVGGKETGPAGKAASILRISRAAERERVKVDLEAANKALEAAKKAWQQQNGRYKKELAGARSRAASGTLEEKPGIELGPGLSGVVFKKEELDALVRALRPRGRVLAVAETAASLPRQTVTGMMDVGQFGIQMATMFYRRPGSWGKAVARSLQAIGNEDAYLRWLGGSEAARRAGSYGIDLGGSEFTEFTREFFASTRIGQKASDTVFKTLLEAAPRGFDSALAASRVF